MQGYFPQEWNFPGQLWLGSGTDLTGPGKIFHNAFGRIIFRVVEYWRKSYLTEWIGAPALIQRPYDVTFGLVP